MSLNDDEEEKMISTSPCGRWEKRNKQFSLREFPCMLGASLAMDTEEGIEVVWIEIRIPYKTECEIEHMKTILDMVVQYSHPNLVKFHDYWIEDRENDKYVVFITESLTCGSVTQFIKKSKLNAKQIVLATWKRWCRQILLGIEYLHTRIPPYVLYNLSCDNIFIQHNGLVKIALVQSLCTIDNSTAAEQHTDRTTKDTNSVILKYRGVQRNRFYADIISFGRICLYIATLEPCSNNRNNTSCNVSDNNNNNEVVPTTKNLLKKLKTINSDQTDFIRICLHSRYDSYPSIIGLLNHSILFEMPSLALICGHVCASNDLKLNNDWEEEENKDNQNIVVKYLRYSINTDKNHTNQHVLTHIIEYKKNEFQCIDIDKYIEAIANGMHPITCFTHKSNDDDFNCVELLTNNDDIVHEDFTSSTGVTGFTNRTIDLISQVDSTYYNRPPPKVHDTLDFNNFQTLKQTTDTQSHIDTPNNPYSSDIKFTNTFGTMDNINSGHHPLNYNHTYITKIKCYIEPSDNPLPNNQTTYFHDSYLYLKIYISDCSTLKFIFGFNRSIDSPSYFPTQILKYYYFIYEDVIFITHVITYSLRYNVPIVCEQYQPPSSLFNYNINLNNNYFGNNTTHQSTKNGIYPTYISKRTYQDIS